MLVDALRQRIAAVGPIHFDEFVDSALYAPGLGFYDTGGGAGRRRDFITAPEVGPLFGAVLARALDQWWRDLGRPDPFVVVEAGAGPGTLARAVLAAGPECGDALRLVLVERASIQWVTHPTGVTSRADLPRPGELGDGPIVVVANELLDNLAFGLVERTAEGWSEVLVDWNPYAGLVEVLAPLTGVRLTWCAQRCPNPVPVGSRMPVQSEAAAWLADALALAGTGRVVVFDYADVSASMAARPYRQWLRTFAAHGRGADPLESPGSNDITCEVAVDQLALVRPPDLDRSQAQFLADHGIDDLVEAGRRIWEEAGGAGGLAAIAGRSRAHEAAALTDPAGMGSFRALEWAAPQPVDSSPQRT